MSTQCLSFSCTFRLDINSTRALWSPRLFLHEMHTRTIRATFSVRDYVMRCISLDVPLLAFTSSLATEMCALLEQQTCTVLRKTLHTCSPQSTPADHQAIRAHTARAAAVRSMECSRCANPTTRYILSSIGHRRCFLWDGPAMGFVDTRGELFECTAFHVERYVVIEWERYTAELYSDRSSSTESAVGLTFPATHAGARPHTPAPTPAH